MAAVPGDVSGAEALEAEGFLLAALPGEVTDLVALEAPADAALEPDLPTDLPLQEIPRLLHRLDSTRNGDHLHVIVIDLPDFDPGLGLDADAVDPVTPVPDDGPNNGLGDGHSLLLMLPDYLLQETSCLLDGLGHAPDEDLPLVLVADAPDVNGGLALCLMLRMIWPPYPRMAPTLDWGMIIVSWCCSMIFSSFSFSFSFLFPLCLKLALPDLSGLNSFVSTSEAVAISARGREEDAESRGSDDT